MSGVSSSKAPGQVSWWFTSQHITQSLPPAFLPTTKQRCLRVRQRLWLGYTSRGLALVQWTLSGGDHLAACHLAGVARGQVAAPRPKISLEAGAAAAGTTTRRHMPRIAGEAVQGFECVSGDGLQWSCGCWARLWRRERDGGGRRPASACCAACHICRQLPKLPRKCPSFWTLGVALGLGHEGGLDMVG